MHNVEVEVHIVLIEIRVFVQELEAPDIDLLVDVLIGRKVVALTTQDCS